jgi:uncharacterized DUF497 family protein
MKFEWDRKKAESNLAKHGVSFEEARTVFYDENARLIDDPDHSGEEDRFILMGISQGLRIITVCHCYRDDDRIRLISARKATKQEKQFYQGDRHA